MLALSVHPVIAKERRAQGSALFRARHKGWYPERPPGAREQAVQEDPREILKAYISEHGLKSSRQREVIAEVFFDSGGHLKVEELLERVREVDPRIGQATVYRTMKLLTKCGLAQPRQFGDGHTRYEPAVQGEEEHHDHLICTACGKIVEFVDSRIERLQDKVASEHGFEVTHHKMELYGLCGECRARGRPSRERPPI